MTNHILPRTFAAIDIENLCGGSDKVQANHELVHHVFESFQRGPTMKVLGTGRFAWQSTRDLPWVWNDCRFLVRTGINGADQALLDCLVSEPVAINSSVVQIWSGDGAFHEAARHLRALGVFVEIYARPKTIADSLRMTANHVIEIPDLSEAIDSDNRRFAKLALA